MNSRHVWMLLSLPLVLAAGCKRAPTQAPAGPASGPKVKPFEGPMTGQGAVEKALRIAVVPKSVSHDFWLTVEAGARAAGEELGVEILWKGTASETDIPEQVDILNDFITQGVDAIVFAASDSKALVPPVERANEAGIPVITIDSGIDPDISKSFVATDNIAGARKAADELCRLIGGAGTVGIVTFVPGAATSIMREKGFKERIEERYPKVRVLPTRYCQSEIDRARAETQDMLTGNPDIKGIFAANESSAMGCVAALEQRNLQGKVKLVAFDAADAEIEALRRGTIQALIVQNPFKMGYEGVKAAVAAVRGEPVSKRVDTGVEVVTLDNIDEPEIKTLLNPLPAKG
ncbi:MAG: ABC transporter substrate-binding protein [Armatimonadota bacterium]